MTVNKGVFKMGIIESIKRLLFRNNIEYMITIILDNKTKINWEICRGVFISKLTINKKSLNITDYIKNYNKIVTILDEETITPLPLELFSSIEQKEINLLDFITIDGKINTSTIDELLSLMNRHILLKNIIKEFDRSNSVMDYNLNIIHSYIITMESIIRQLFTVIHK